MRIQIHFHKEEPIAVPIQYNHIIQAIIYSWIEDEQYSKFIHNQGYQLNEKTYKLFTFSRLEGLYKLDRNTRKIIFDRDMSLVISSASEEFLKYLLSNILLENNELNIGGTKVRISRVGVKETPAFFSKTKIYTLSPCTAYTTLENKQTRFYNPFDYEFSEYMKNNLINKYQAYYGREPENSEFFIKPAGSVKQAKVNYKNFHILAYNGEMEMEGSEELQKMAYDAGIGGKNSSGFGCIEIKNNRR